MRYTRRYNPARSAVARALLCSAMVLGISACDGTLWQRLGIEDARTGLESGETQLGARRAPMRNPGGQGYSALMEETGGTPVSLASAPRTAPSGNPGAPMSDASLATVGPSSSPGISPMQSNAQLAGAQQAPVLTPFDMYDASGNMVDPGSMAFTPAPSGPAPAMTPMPQPQLATASVQSHEWYDPRGWFAEEPATVAMQPQANPTATTMTPANSYVTERTPIGMSPVSTEPFEVAQAAPVPPAPMQGELPPMPEPMRPAPLPQHFADDLRPLDTTPWALAEPPVLAPAPGSDAQGYPNLGTVPPAPRMRSPAEVMGSYQGLEEDHRQNQQARESLMQMPVPQVAPSAPPPVISAPQPVTAPEPAPQQVIEQTRPETAQLPPAYYAPPPPLPEASMAGEPYIEEMVVSAPPPPLQLRPAPPLDTASLRAPMPEARPAPMPAPAFEPVYEPVPMQQAYAPPPDVMYQPAPESAFDGPQPLSAGMLTPPPAAAAPVLAAPMASGQRFLPESRYAGRRTSKPLFSN